MFDLRSELERFDCALPIERAWTPPASWYTAAPFYDLEKRAVFGRTWQPVARASQLAQPGAYASGCMAGEPWVVVRDGAGALRAFANTCRHKGREVVTGDGVAEALVCGYHGWRYDLDGRLLSAPKMAGVEDFERTAMALPPLAVEQWGHWVFVNPDCSAPGLVESLPELDTRLAASDWTALTYAGSSTWTIGCNWKVYVDNYLDGGYHIPHMHPSLEAQLEMSSYRTEVFERCSIQSSGPGAGDVQRIGEGPIYAWIYPNFMINRYGPCLDTNYVRPLGPDRCAVDYEFYFADADDAFVERSKAQADITQREDIEICESVQVGLRSTSYDRGRYAPQLEQGDHHFHRLLAEALAAGAAL